MFHKKTGSCPGPRSAGRRSAGPGAAVAAPGWGVNIKIGFGVIVPRIWPEILGAILGVKTQMGQKSEENPLAMLKDAKFCALRPRKKIRCGGLLQSAFLQ